MMIRVAWRSLMTRPIRAAVLAAGFGFGIGVMATLLGVGQVILEQAHAPALRGGGDLVVAGPFGSVTSARFLISSVFAAPDVAPHLKTASPSRSARLFLMTPGGPVTVAATGGIPSLEKSLDGEVAGADAWVDAPGDERWRHPDRGEVLRAMDRFHAVPDVRARVNSWAEWLYFNGRSRDGRLRIYLTFLVGPPAGTKGMRTAGVRLQLERDGRSTNYSARADVDEALVLALAPDLEIAGNRVRLDGLTYRITLALPGLAADLELEAPPGRSMPPASVGGAGGWVTGYVVPVLSGALRGTLQVGTERLTLDASGYHDHNWGFWEGVSWQWGQVGHDDLSVVYGRVFPPADVADPARVPGFLVLLGPSGPLGFSTNVTIDDAVTDRVHVRASGKDLDLQLELGVDETVRSPMALTGVADGQPLNFFQIGGRYHVKGTVAGRQIDFTARGSAETFKPQSGKRESGKRESGKPQPGKP
ncbi:MAG: hypothetical protein ABI868_22870 [Acidobacteriota bacterium]